MNRPSPTPIYHLTHIANLSTIVKSGLRCDRAATANDLLSKNIGNHNIKERRRKRKVTVRPFGVVADYVPFYFAPRSPMMYSIWKGNVPTYTGGIGRLVYLATTLERLLKLGLDPVLTDRNASLAYAAHAQLRTGLPSANFIDWQLMKEKYWFNTKDDPHREERRMAECLVHGVVPWEAIQFVGAKDNNVLNQVRAIVAGAHAVPRLGVRRDWYF